MRVENFLSSRIVTSTREFNAKIEHPTFYDAIPLGKNSAVMIADGMVLSNTNVISVSSKIYSASKVSFCVTPPISLFSLSLNECRPTQLFFSLILQLLLWRTFFFVSGGFAMYGGLRSRLFLTGQPDFGLIMS